MLTAESTYCESDAFSGTLSDYIGQNFDRKQGVEKMPKATARHILVVNESLSEELKTRIVNGEDFESLAREHSTCPSSQQGGDLGTFGPGQMVQEFDTVVFTANLNEVQGPVKTQFGYHLIEVTSRIE